MARHDGAVLLIRRTDNGNWALPGGAVEMNESVAGAAVRETFKETGIQAEVTGLLGVYSDPGHVIHFPSNARSAVSSASCWPPGPSAASQPPSAESSEVRWVAPGDLGGYTMGRAMRKRVDDYLNGTRAAHRLAR